MADPGELRKQGAGSASQAPSPFVGDVVIDTLSIHQRLTELRNRLARQTDASIEETAAMALSAGGFEEHHVEENLTARAKLVIDRLEEQSRLLEEMTGQTSPLFDVDSPVAGAEGLISLAREALRCAAPSPAEQIRLMPALQEVLYRLEQLTAGLREARQRQQATASLLESIKTFHATTLRENALNVAELVGIADRQIEAVERDSYPIWLTAPTREPADWIAEGAANAASIVAFLASMEPDWRAKQRPLVIAAIVRDLGMLKLPRELLVQPSVWSDEQRQQLHQHPLFAGLLLERAGMEEDAVQAAVGHHERLDGAGYPRGLTEDTLGLPARLLAAVDHYVARRSLRPHRRAANPRQALTESLTESENGKLDRWWSSRLLNLSFYPVGSMVELATGEIGEVIAPQDARTDPHLAALPIVRLHVDRVGQRLIAPSYRNLAQRPESRVVRQLSSIEASHVLRSA